MRKVIGALVVLAVVGAVALAVWQPWSSGGDTQQAIDEALPSAVAETPDLSSAPASPGARSKQRAKPPKPFVEPKPEVVELASGEFEDAEYETDGSAKIVELADGRRFLRIEGFSTSQAPVIQVAFSEAPSGGEWGSYDDVRFASVGSLKALTGNQNYEIPKGLDLAGFRSVVIWCDKYDVALGTAPVTL